MRATSHNVASGFTLIEVLVAASLTLVMITLITQFILPTMVYQSRGMIQTELMRQGYRAMDGLVRDLRLCPAALLSFDPVASRLCGRLRSHWTPDGTALYSAECWVYEWEERPWLRKAEVFIGANLGAMSSGGLTTPYRVSPSELAGALAGARRKTLCACLASLEFRHQGLDIQAPSGRYEVRMCLQQDRQRLEIQQCVTPRRSR